MSRAPAPGAQVRASQTAGSHVLEGGGRAAGDGEDGDGDGDGDGGEGAWRPPGANVLGCWAAAGRAKSPVSGAHSTSAGRAAMASVKIGVQAAGALTRAP
ncbi:hypothetical protein GCM10017668_62440 [Streptomyces tuirus]|uniref:Uncharacterized protein n=1 Tax=Streptomyces tuirus TaxID=68278 RepID=A0A7G1NPD6_9ACTN|nr:hypothetical protein GCM10017668_62440 [Streptomyces tuirus]